LLYYTLTGRYLIEADFKSLDSNSLDDTAKQSKNTLYKILGGAALVKLWSADIGRTMYERLLRPFIEPLTKLIPDLSNVVNELAKEKNLPDAEAKRKAVETKLTKIAKKVLSITRNRYFVIGVLLIVTAVYVLALSKTKIHAEVDTSEPQNATSKKKLFALAVQIKQNFNELFNDKAGRVGIVLFVAGVAMIGLSMRNRGTI